jgi:hypothetical protein
MHEVVRDVRLECDGEGVELTRAQASALADFLWRGLLPGAAVAAARLTDALSTAPADGMPDVRFEPYQWPAIRTAIAALERAGSP